MTTTPDIADFDLENMLAELDAQTIEIAAASAPPVAAAEPELDESDMDEIEAAVAAPEPVAAAPEPVVVIDEPTQPTASHALTAEQELDLAEVFEPDENVAVVKTPTEASLDDVAAEMELQDEVKVEPTPVVELEVDPKVELQADPKVELEAAPQVELESKTIPSFEPKPSERVERSDKAMFELTRIKYQPDIESFNRDIAFTDATLDTAMVSQASLVAYQNERAARASAQASKLKLKFDSIEAILYEAYRKDFLDQGVKVTEKAIENAVRKDSRWIKAKEAVIEAEMYSDIHRGFVFALKDRNDMLIQRGSYRRQEMQGQMRFQESMDHSTNPSNNANVGSSSAHSAAMRAMKKASSEG